MKVKREGNETKKGFFAELLEKLDKKMEEKAKSGSGCCRHDEQGEKKSCCS